MTVGVSFSSNAEIGCEGIFRSSANGLSRTANEIQKTYTEHNKDRFEHPATARLFSIMYARQALLRQYSYQENKNEIEFSTDILSRLKIGQILKLASSFSLCRKVAEHPEGYRVFDPFSLTNGPREHSLYNDHPHVNPEVLHYRAKILALVHLLTQAEAAGVNVLTPKLFSRITELENLTTQVFPLSYRFDSRSPDEIRNLNGFFPNKRLGSIYEHSDSNSQGVAYISLSTTEGNQFNLSLEPVRNSALKKSILSLTESQMTEVKQLAFKGRPVVLEVYEYRVKNLLAVRPHIYSRIKEEDEIVAPTVHRGQISHYRKIIYVIDDRGPGEARKVMYLNAEPWVELD